MSNTGEKLSVNRKTLFLDPSGVSVASAHFSYRTHPEYEPKVKVGNSINE